MYTWEIENTLRNYNNNIPSNVYFDICNTSPQIDCVKYDGFNKNYMIHTRDKQDAMYFTVYPCKN